MWVERERNRMEWIAMLEEAEAGLIAATSSKSSHQKTISGF